MGGRAARALDSGAPNAYVVPIPYDNGSGSDHECGNTGQHPACVESPLLGDEATPEVEIETPDEDVPEAGLPEPKVVHDEPDADDHSLESHPFTAPGPADSRVDPPGWQDASGPDSVQPLTRTPEMVEPPSVETTWVSVAGGFALAWLLRLIWICPLFSRLHRDGALENDVRARIHALVEAEPGIHLRMIARRLEINRSQVRHHVHVLERTGWLRKATVRGYDCLFATPGHPKLEAVGRRALKSPRARSILAAIGTGQPTNVRDLQSATGLTGQAIRYHAQQLVEAGLLVAGERPSGTCYAATPAAHKIEA